MVPTLLSTPDLTRFLALTLKDSPYWMTPVWGNGPAEVPPETQFVLWQTQTVEYHVAIPLVTPHTRATLQGSSEGLVCSGEVHTQHGAAPYALIRSAMSHIAAASGTFRLRSEKPVPAFLDLLGWCTWDAFYQEVTPDGIIRGLQSFEQGNVHPGFVIIDDGWQDTRGDFLVSLRTHPAKFPQGLAPLAHRMKAEFGVQHVGVWHALHGYWAGIDPEGELAQAYGCLSNEGVIRPWEGTKKNPVHFVPPHNAARFFNDYHQSLHQAGVSLVKVDVQAALPQIASGVVDRVPTVRAYQQALQASVATHFDGEMIHCMSNANDIAQHMYGANVWRNSDDYFPRRGPEAQQKHLIQNAYNAVWAHTFAWLDWDMFQSAGAAPAFHAAARALSGGPMYLSDRPGENDFGLLKKISPDGSRVFRLDRPALPTADLLFVDPSVTPQALALSNHRNGTGVLGFFHCTRDVDVIEATYAQDQVPECDATPAIAWLFNAQTLAEPKGKLRLEPLTAEIVTFAPIDHGVAVLGNLDLYAGAAIIDRHRWINDIHVTDFKAGGRLGYFCAREPSAVYIGEKRIAAQYCEATSLLTCHSESPGPARVSLHFTPR